MAWSVLLVDEVDGWFVDLADRESDCLGAVTAAIDLLESKGPALGRPVADRLKGSKYHNLKELRPSGTSVRIIFIFDPARNAVLLAAGDKSGDWDGWYDVNIPLAEQRYEAWLNGDYDEEVR